MGQSNFPYISCKGVYGLLTGVPVIYIPLNQLLGSSFPIKLSHAFNNSFALVTLLSYFYLICFGFHNHFSVGDPIALSMNNHPPPSMSNHLLLFSECTTISA